MSYGIAETSTRKEWVEEWTCEFANLEKELMFWKSRSNIGQDHKTMSMSISPRENGLTSVIGWYVGQDYKIRSILLSRSPRDYELTSGGHVDFWTW